jgi:hypothetical protein
VHIVEQSVAPDQELDVAFDGAKEVCFIFGRGGEIEAHRGHGREVHLNIPPIRAGDAAWDDDPSVMSDRFLNGVMLTVPVWRDEPEKFKSTLHVLLRDGSLLRQPNVTGLALVVTPDPATIRARRLGWALINEDFLDD